MLGTKGKQMSATVRKDKIANLRIENRDLQNAVASLASINVSMHVRIRELEEQISTGANTRQTQAPPTRPTPAEPGKLAYKY